jgi:hypothetical protein
MRAIARALRLAGARPVIVGVVRVGGRGSAATVDFAPVADGDHEDDELLGLMDLLVVAPPISCPFCRLQVLRLAASPLALLAG